MSEKIWYHISYFWNLKVQEVDNEFILVYPSFMNNNYNKPELENKNFIKIKISLKKKRKKLVHLTHF